jgi:glycosyltransferase involved in cell wall biosynthesis
MQQSSSKITIGMPVFNGEKYINEAIESLLSQTFVDFELVISDNCSTDKTAKICNEYVLKDKRIRYFRQNQNIGALKNFEFVLKYASGEYFMWAACDDKWSKNWLESIYNELQTSNCKMVLGRVIHIDEHGFNINHPANNLDLSFLGYQLQRKLKFFIWPEYLGKANTIHSIYHASLIPTICKYWNYFSLGKSRYDFLFLYNMLNETKIKSINNTYIFKRIHNQSQGHITTSTKDTFLLKSILRKISLTFNPLPKLTQDYYYNSVKYEKVLIVLFSPVKVIVAFLCKARDKVKDS